VATKRIVVEENTSGTLLIQSPMRKLSLARNDKCQEIAAQILPTMFMVKPEHGFKFPRLKAPLIEERVLGTKLLLGLSGEYHNY
jgi:hypothetical protein